MTDELLIRYITGQAKPHEEKLVLDWAMGSDKNQEELSWLQNAWVLAGIDQETDIERKSVEIEKIIQIVRQRKISSKKETHPHSFWLRNIAAILVVALFSGVMGYLFSHSEKRATVYTEVVVPRGERSKVILPDGSTVQLNSETRIKFPSSFSDKKRTVEIEGEAFFDVVHNASKPFVVHTHDVDIEVLGTRFDVCSYSGDPSVQTYLEKGSVLIRTNQPQSVSYILKPSEALRYNRESGQLQKIVYKDNYITDWTKGVLTIRGETIEELARKLERRFDVQINFADDEVRSHTYTGSIKNEDISTVLEALHFASSLTYKRKGNTITLSSSRK